MSHQVVHPPASVIKRNGATVPFDGEEIRSAIERAGKATGGFEREEAQLLASQAFKVLAHRFGGRAPHIEQIQDVVEQVLISANHFSTARAYIVYREQRSRLRRDQRTLVDVAASINEYLDRAGLARQRQRQPGLFAGRADPQRLGQADRQLLALARLPAGDRRAPTATATCTSTTSTCWRATAPAGRCAPCCRRASTASPARSRRRRRSHLSSAVGQIVNFLGTLQNEWAGAQAFSSFDTYMAPFVRKDRLGYEEVRQCIQELIYNLNVPSRWGTQTPFTNLTFDWTCPEDLRGEAPVIAGESMPFTYGELQPEMDMINRAYIEVMTAGDAKGRVFTFPIPTYNITPDFPWESENADRLFAMTAKYGLPYFQNFINSELKPNMIRSMCCRLQLDLRELLKRGNGLFGSAEQTGSLGVVTLNCARLGYLYKGDEAALFARLDELLDIARNSLEIKRKVIQRHMDDGLFPYHQALPRHAAQLTSRPSA